MPSFEDRNQTNRVTILANANPWQLTSFSIPGEQCKNQGQRAGGSEVKSENRRTRPIVIPSSLTSGDQRLLYRECTALSYSCRLWATSTEMNGSDKCRLFAEQLSGQTPSSRVAWIRTWPHVANAWDGESIARRRTSRLAGGATTPRTQSWHTSYAPTTVLSCPALLSLQLNHDCLATYAFHQWRN